MIFGNRDSFGIEATVEDHLTPPSAAWGRMCVWIRGEMIGDLKEPHCGLEAVWDFQATANSLGSLWDERLRELSAMEIFEHLNRALYDDDDRSMELIRADSARYSRFNFLTNWGEMFNHVKAFVISPPGEAVLIAFRRSDDTISSARIDRDTFVSSIADLVDWYSHQEERLEAKPE